jgi:hypothetical protein
MKRQYSTGFARSHPSKPEIVSAKSPLMVMPVTFSGVAPGLSTVMTCAALVLCVGATVRHHGPLFREWSARRVDLSATAL